jgi:hypothetical protein
MVARIRPIKARGQAMVELLIVAGFVLVPLFLAIPLLGKYLDIRSSAVQAARYAAWERTVWYGGESATAMGWFGVDRKWIANAKTDAQIRNEIGVRQLSKTESTDAFSSADRSASSFKNGTKEIWQDRSSTPLLANYSDTVTAVANGTAPGTLSKLVKPIADFASTLGPFVLEMGGKYTAKVTINIKDIAFNDNFLAKNSTSKFSESNVLLANGWSADGPDDATKNSVTQEVKGLVPTSIFTLKIGDTPVIEPILKVVSVFLPEMSKLKLGKVAPDEVPPDRVK